jgi:hypothetical protein
MKAYARNQLKRLAAQEACSGVVSRSECLGARASAPEFGGVPAPWARFASAYEDAASSATKGAELAGLLRLSRCPRYAVRRVHRCGAEAPFAEAWCGAAYCPACTRERESRVSRTLITQWGAGRLFSVEIPVGRQGGLVLPRPGAVAAVREAWARVTARVASCTTLPRIEAMPRLVLTPDGVTQILRFPWRAKGAASRVAEECLLEAVRLGCRRIGLRGVIVERRSTEQAATLYARAQSLEAQRFLEAVVIDLDRLDALSWREPLAGDASLKAALRASANRWVSRQRARRKASRRRLEFGGRDALPAPHPNLAPGTAVRCPDHGGDCPPEALYVRDLSDRGRLVAEAAPDALGERPRTVAIASLVAGATVLRAA